MTAGPKPLLHVFVRAHVAALCGDRDTQFLRCSVEKCCFEKATWKAFVDGVSMYERYTHDGLCGSPILLVDCSSDFCSN